MEKPKPVSAEGAFLCSSPWSYSTTLLLEGGGPYPKRLSDFPSNTSKLDPFHGVCNRKTYLFDPSLHYQTGLLQGEFPLLSTTPAWFTKWEARSR